MRKRQSNTAMQRLLNTEELSAYLGLGQTKARQFAKDAGAVKKIGRRCLYDVRILDDAIDRLAI